MLAEGPNILATCSEHEPYLQGDLLLCHGSLHRLVHLRVLDSKAAEDGERLQKLLIVPVESFHAA